MIRPSYALKLARTKLRSKRGVLIASIIVASLLFATLIASIIIFSSSEKSATEFIEKAGNDRYLVHVSPYIPHKEVSYSNPPSLEDIREIKDFEKRYYSDLRDKHEQLGLKYREENEIPTLLPASWMSETLPDEQRVTVNWASPAVQAMNAEKFTAYAKTAKNKFTNLKEVGGRYGAEGYYIVDKSSQLPSIPGLRLIQDGEEDFGSFDQKSSDMTTYGYYINAIYNGGYRFTDQRLLDRYILPTDNKDLKGIPVVVSAQEAASLFGDKFGIDTEPEAANEKIDWLKDVQDELNGHTYQVCYRNSAEQALLEKIQRDYTEMNSNQNTQGYQKPSLIYDYPHGLCEGVVVKEDTRTLAEKQADADTIATQELLGTYTAPESRLLTFQIVGIKYAQPYTDHTEGVSQYIKSLLSTQNPSMALDIPLQMYEKLPDELKIGETEPAYSVTPDRTSDDFVSRVLEFASVDQARAFMENETCPQSSTNCDKKFLASPYGSNYLILDEIGRLFGRIAAVAFPVVLGLAAVIIWFTISRIMSENRKETAVYRAMGARRRDVTIIYIMYSLLVALYIAIVSLVVGVIAAWLVDYFYGSHLSNIAVTAFGIIDQAPKFSVFRVDSPLIALTILSIFVVSIIASIQPLIRNVRRNPVYDMRDEG